MNPSLIDRFAAIVGDKYALTDAADTSSYTIDARGRYDAPTNLVLRPATNTQVSDILRLASETQTSVIPQGGNTGLVGAGLPLNDRSGGEIIISLGRMNTILEVDTDTNTMLVESGAVLQNIQTAADEADRLFPLSLGSQGSCQIGGNISSNAGGTGVLAYGNTRELVMGLEVVMANGEIWNGLSRLRKDNTGYDLKDLFIGAEGTLGIITKAILKLFPKPKGRDVAFAAVTSPSDAIKLLNLSQSVAGNSLTGFELMASRAMEFTLKHTPGGIRRPIADQSPWYVLLEISSGVSDADAKHQMENILTTAYESELVKDAAIAQSVSQQNEFWVLRESMSGSQKPEGASIKHDISIPVGSVPDFIEQADQAIMDLIPGARICNFGHLGDGNLHYNISQPFKWTAEAFFERESEVHELVYSIVSEFGGSISAEHGIGQMKRDKLAIIKDPVALTMMRQIKDTFDPAGILNPGKVLQKID